MRKRFRVVLLAASRLAETARGGEPASTPTPRIWRDPSTKLTWANADNGFGVSAAQAAYYCANLTLGRYRDWRLPDIEELQQLFGGVPDANGHHLAGPIKVTAWAWSSTPGKAPGEQWELDFGDGGRASAVTGDSGLNRALCVRGRISR